MIGNSVFRFNHPQEAEKLREINQVKLFINKSNRNNNFNQIPSSKSLKLSLLKLNSTFSIYINRRLMLNYEFLSKFKKSKKKDKFHVIFTVLKC